MNEQQTIEGQEGQNQSWGSFDIRGLQSRWAIGAGLEAVTGERRQLREVIAGSNFKSQDDYVLHVGAQSAGNQLAAMPRRLLLGLDFERPFLFLTGEDLKGANEYFFQRAKAPVYEVTLSGARHANFHDMALTIPVAGKLSGGLGDLDPAHGLEIVRAYALAFMDEHLRERPSELLSGAPSPYPEIEIRMRLP